MFFILKILVLFEFSFRAVCKNSHDLMAKNSAPMSSQDVAVSHSVVETSIIFLNTDIGNAFCFRLDPSIFRYALHCSVSMKHVLPSASSRGSSLWFALKACATYYTVELTVPSTRCSPVLLEKVPSLTAWAKAEMIIFLWNVSHPSRKGVASNPIEYKKVFQCFHALVRLVLVESTVALERVVTAEWMK